jgi:hypothetical protein
MVYKSNFVQSLSAWTREHLAPSIASHTLARAMPNQIIMFTVGGLSPSAVQLDFKLSGLIEMAHAAAQPGAQNYDNYDSASREHVCATAWMRGSLFRVFGHDRSEGRDLAVAPRRDDPLQILHGVSPDQPLLRPGQRIGQRRRWHPLAARRLGHARHRARRKAPRVRRSPGRGRSRYVSLSRSRHQLLGHSTDLPSQGVHLHALHSGRMQTATVSASSPPSLSPATATLSMLTERRGRNDRSNVVSTTTTRSSTVGGLLNGTWPPETPATMTSRFLCGIGCEHC